MPSTTATIKTTDLEVGDVVRVIPGMQNAGCYHLELDKDYKIDGINSNGNVVLEGIPGYAFLMGRFVQWFHGTATPIDMNSTPHTCRWKRYDGFTRRFDYCEVCDVKRDVPA
jgi:hypothetical protein